MLNGEVETITAQSNGYIYEIIRKENAKVLYVKDITEYALLRKQYEQCSGLLQLDNYMEYQQYEDESRMATDQHKASPAPY